jgi:hypothetical protein
MKNSPYVFILLASILFGTSACKRERLSYESQQMELNDLLATVDGESKIPDFSFAGFERNEKPMPDVPTVITITPRDGDDGQRIQDAITEVSQLPLINGYRGAILIKAGNYEVERPLIIGTSGVVIRGEGQGETGTVITSTAVVNSSEKFSLIRFLSANPNYKEIGSRLILDNDLIKVGATKIPVSSSSGFAAGDTVYLVKTPNQKWIDTLGMAQYDWTPATYTIAHFRTIKKVEPGALYLDIPVVDAMYGKLGGGYIVKATVPGKLSHCGVENLRLKSVYASDVDENHAWIGVQFSGVTNSWVKKVTTQYFAYSSVSLFNQSDFNTIEDCASLDPKSEPLGERRYAFNIDKGMGNLFQRCYSRYGRHDFVTGSRVTGPNVFLDCLSLDATSDIGPHQRWATGILFDNIAGPRLYAYNQGGLGTGHGWVGAQIMFWNCTAGSELAIDNPPTGVNWAIGCRGGYARGAGTFIAQGFAVTPRSIFVSQLEKRLGSEAVTRVTNQAQRNNTILDYLATWAGN